MPAVNYIIRWPDGEQLTCYSPSTIILKYFNPGQSYSVKDFVKRNKEALTIASDRVQAKYGVACSAAQGQLEQIIKKSRNYALEEQVEFLGFEQ